MKIAVTGNGFSMVELIATMAVMGIVTAVALPNWHRLLPNSALNNSTRQVQSELHSIKMRAAAENISFQFTYTQGASGYTIQRDAKDLVTKPLAEGTTITEDGRILFSPRGTASGNRVRLRNINGMCRQVVVSSTGRVRICTPKNCTEDC